MATAATFDASERSGGGSQSARKYVKPRSASGKSASVSVARPHVLSKYLDHFDRSSFLRLANVGSSDILARRTPRNPHGGIEGRRK